MEKIVGKIIKVTYFNSTNGFAFVKIKIDFNKEGNEIYQDMLYSNTLTVGCTYSREPLEGEEYIYTGEFVETKYGIQLKASSYKQENIESKDAIVTYLSSDFFPSIGKVTACKIYDTLGGKCLELIASNKNELDKVLGLSQTQKDIIYETILKDNLEKNNLLSFINMGFTFAMASRIVNTIPESLLEKAMKNPYYLINKVDGIGFLRADKIALKIGIKPNDKLRVQTCILYLVSEYIRSTGNTYIDMHLLKENTLSYLNKDNDVVKDDDITKAIDHLVVNKLIHIDELNNVYDAFIYNCELNLGTYIIKHLKRPIDDKYKLNDITSKLELVSKQNKITYSKNQEQAIIKALRNNITIITGGPGTGKTTIVKGIIRVYKELNNNIASNEILLLAPTGRAGKRLNEVAMHEAQTIHRALGYDGRRYQFNNENLLNCKLVIIDEVSMVDVELAYRLFSALPMDVKIVLVGDVDQIPSVGPGEVLANLIKTKEIDTIRLDKIHRQASDSSIINLAHKINNGIIPDNILDKLNDRTFIQTSSEDIINCIKKVMESAINKGMDLIRDIQVLIPRYKGKNGIDNINLQLQEEFNPLLIEGEEFKTDAKRFRIKDKVIQLINRNEDQIMNGDIGFVSSFKHANNQITEMSVCFDNKIINYSKEELDQISLAYAISIHKSQGSEFKTVIIPLTNEYYIMLKRKLYYTAITRAKDYLILIGDVKALDIASKTLGEERKTKLYDYIVQGMNKKELTPFDFLDEPTYSNINIDEDIY